MASVGAILSRKKARYPAYVAIGLFVVLQILSHDLGIYQEVDDGADSSILGQLFIAGLGQMENRILGLVIIGLIVGFVSYAIAIRIAQSKNREIRSRLQ